MKYMIIGLFLLFAGNIYAQVRGTVKDSTGEAIPGANVFWMNTGQGVTTKEDGSFSITKPSKSHMLIVSFIGFQDRKSTRLNSSHRSQSRMPSSA